jgi:glycosyltransferase involved in cell wall biosynthesis
MSFASLFVVGVHASSDARTRSMAESLAAEGGRVDVLSFRDTLEKPEETIAGVRYIRLPVRRAGGSLYRRLFEEAAFSLFAFFFACVLSCRRRYALFHARGTPDLLVLCGILSRLLGARVVIDLPEPAPETARAEHGLAPGSRVVRALRWMEAFAIGCADVATTSSEGFRRALVERGADPGKIRVIHDPIDPAFRPVVGGESARRPDTFRLVCRDPSPRCGAIETVIRALALVRRKFPGLRLDLFAGSEARSAHEPLARSLGLTGVVVWRRRSSPREEADLCREADALLVAAGRDPLDEKRLPRTLLEGLALGLPVLAPRLPGLLEAFSEEEALYHEPADARDLARAVYEAATRPERVAEARAKGQAALARLRPPAGRDPYLSLVQGLWGEILPVARQAGGSPVGE